MPYEHKEGRFSLFPNRKKKNEKDPDYTGKGMVDGEICYFSAWVNQKEDNEQWLSCSISKPKDKPQGPPAYRPPALAPNRVQNPQYVPQPPPQPPRPANPFLKAGFKPPPPAAPAHPAAQIDDVPF